MRVSEGSRVELLMEETEDSRDWTRSVGARNVALEWKQPCNYNVSMVVNYTGYGT